MATINVYQPDVEDEVAEPASMASRDGLPEHPSLVLVDNGKPKAKELLSYIAEELRKDMAFSKVEVFSKEGASKPLTDEQADSLASQFDLAIAGLGDCGACSACSAYDAVELERRGVPSTVVISDIFPGLVSNFVRTRGLAGYHFSVVPHPVSSKSDEQLHALARSVASAVRDQLIGTPVLAGSGASI